MYYFVASLLIFIGLAHSILGERFILIRLFRRDNLPKLYGSDNFTKNTLRFAWHVTTVAWFGFAAVVVHLADGELNVSVVGNIIAATFFVHFLISMIGAKGKHFSWVFFLLISGIMGYLSNF